MHSYIVFRRKAFLVMLVAGLLILEGCGFRLRGTIELPEEYDTIYVHDRSTSANIVPALEQLLKRNKIQFVEQEDQAKVIIEVDRENYGRRILTVSSGGNVEEFELTYTLKYSITQRELGTGQLDALLKNQTINLKRVLRFDENAVLAKTSEEQTLRKDMVNAAAEQIIRRLYRLKNVKS